MTAGWHTDLWRRFAPAYMLDLAASLLLVLFSARFLGVVATDQAQNPWLLDLHAAFSRFTPDGLWTTYSEHARTAIINLGHVPGRLVLLNVLFGLRLLWCVLLAVPDTLLSIWAQTETWSDWVTLIGFGMILAATFVILVAGRRMSLPRLVEAVVASPLAAIAVFWVVQQTVLDILYGFTCFTAVAPWCLLCPVACTLYWVAFPEAEHGATVTCLQAVGRLRTGGRRGPRVGKAAHKRSTTGAPRKQPGP